MKSANWISIPKVEGESSSQAHADLPEGTFERELGKEGFFGPATHMYHTHPPTGWSNWEGNLRPRAFDLNKAHQFVDSPWAATAVLSNAHVQFRLWRTQRSMEILARNGDGDELIFVHEGKGELFCDYGHLSFSPGDYIMLPRGTMWRIECAEPCFFLLIEATNSSYQLPERGLVGQHAIFDPAALKTPKIDDMFKAQSKRAGTYKVAIKRRGAISTVTFPFNPLDAIGWHGTLSPVQINWREFRPLMSHRQHLPPSAHTTFVANRFVVCTFVPRPFESDEGALKVPFFHNNDDFDEVLFYHQGNFFSRDNIKPGMLTLHPCGFTHGPHPKALQNAFKMPKEDTDEVAVMLDTRDALDVAAAIQNTEWPGYVDSWKTPVEKK
ncbi:MAG: homogentisate 1,2-dioxygenase [Dongiaceae bacterium]